MPTIKMPEVHMPKVDMKAKLHDMNESIKNTKMPTSQEIKDGYLNSNFHKSFHQQLAVSNKVLEDQEIAKSRQELVKNKSPSELAHMNHPFDIPLPKIKFNVKAKRSASDPNADTHSLNVEDLDENKSRLLQTLPKAWRQQNLVTATKIMDDQDEAKTRQELVKAKNPTQLAEFHSIKDIPIPSKVKSILSPSERKIMAQKQQNQRKSSSASVHASSTPKEPFNLSLPKSWKETKLITQTRDDLDLEEAKKRREIVQTKTPKELARFHGFDDIPVPSKVSTLFKAPELKRPELKKPDLKNMVKRSKSETSIKSATKATSWRDQKLVTKIKVEEINDELEQRREIASKKTPAELAQITSLQDIPVPTTLKRMIKSDKKLHGADEPPVKFSTLLKNKLSRSMSNIEGKSSSSSSSNWMNAECVVRKRIEDPKVQAERAETVKNKTVAELSQIHSLSDLPIPSALQHLTDTAKRPRRQEIKPMQEYVPQSLKSTLLVSSKIELDPEVLRERMELNRSKSPTQLSEIHSLSDVPIPKMFRTPTTSRPVSPASQPEQSNW